MGMDLVAVNPDVDTFYANWSGWGTLRDLLWQLGCDMEQMSGSNDGDTVDADTARAWGESLQGGLGRVFAVKYPDATYLGGWRSELRVENSERELILSSSDIARGLVASMLGKSEEAGATDEVPQTVSLDQLDDGQTLEWLQSFARFCRDSGGFQQY